VRLELLSGAERARFVELAVFPEDAEIPVGVAKRCGKGLAASRTSKPRVGSSSLSGFKELAKNRAAG
jgi:hypothetical protein